MDQEWIKQYAERRAARPFLHQNIYTKMSLVHNYPLFPQKNDVWSDLFSSCLFTVFAAGFGGYVMGLAFGFVFSAMEQNTVDTSLSYRTQVSQVYKGTWTKMQNQAKAFSTFGALYVALECPLENYRGRHDPLNSLIAGSFTGGIFSIIGKGGIRGTLIGAGTCGVFCYAIDYIMAR